MTIIAEQQQSNSILWDKLIALQEEIIRIFDEKAEENMDNEPNLEIHK